MVQAEGVPRDQMVPVDARVSAVLGATVAIALVEPDGMINDTSAQWRELFGETSEEATGKHWGTLCHPDDRQAVAAAADAAQTSGETVRVEFRRPVTPEQSSERWIGIGITPLCPHQPDAGWLVTAADITQRLVEVHARQEAFRALERGNHLLATLVDNLHLGVVFVSEDGRIMAANRLFCELLAINSPDSLVGQSEDCLEPSVRQLVKGPERLLREISRARLQQRGPTHADVELLDGRTLEGTFIPISGQGHLWLLRDQTAEREMASRQAHLLAQEQLQNDRLRDLDALRREFAALLAHEFRTPLTSILGYSEMMDADAEETDPQILRTYVDVIRRNGERLLRLVDDLFVLDRLEARTLPAVAQDVHMAEVVSMGVRSLRAAAQGKGVTLRTAVQPGPQLRGDAERLGQMLDNLLTNALKFTGPGGQIMVEAAPIAEGWVVEVADSGIGIPEPEIPDLFERFYRASNAKQLAIRGSGLGLALVRAVVDQHHGAIEVESTLGVGTTVRVHLRGLRHTDVCDA